MEWIAFSYSLPSKANTPRVTLWRRLRRLGAISPTGGVYILPAVDDCIESFQWLAQEINQGAGDALVMHVTHFDGVVGEELVAQFNHARQDEYEQLSGELAELEKRIAAADADGPAADFQTSLQQLQKKVSDITRIDYFHAPQGPVVAAQLNRLQQQLAFDDPPLPPVAAAAVAQYQGRKWVTRPLPHVDRLACAWLIRRFIDPAAVIRYGADPQPEEVAFDMEGAEFTHHGNLCTFEVMVQAFQLDDRALAPVAEIVHEIDLRDGRYQRPETAGIDAALRGWLLAGLPDVELETHGIGLFEGVFRALSPIEKPN